MPNLAPSSRAKLSVATTTRAFDQYLANRFVQLGDEFADFFHFLGRIHHQQGVGALVIAYLSARREESASLLIVTAAGAARPAPLLGFLRQQVGNFLGFPVADRNIDGDGLGQLFQFLLGTAANACSRSAISFCGATQMTLPLRRLSRSLRAQHDIQRLIPWHIDQAQRDIARDGVGTPRYSNRRPGRSVAAPSGSECPGN